MSKTLQNRLARLDHQLEAIADKDTLTTVEQLMEVLDGNEEVTISKQLSAALEAI